MCTHKRSAATSARLLLAADDVVSALAREGYPVDLDEDLFGEPIIESAMGIPCSISFSSTATGMSARR